MNPFRIALATVMAVVVVTQTGCATGQTRKIALGMVAGAVVGAVVGHEFVHHGEYRQYETRNTIITAVVGALATGGVMAWHYNALEEQQVEISGRYARYRLCNPDDMPPELARKLNLGEGAEGGVQVQENQVGRLAISLDDNTKWAYPIFRKRYLQPERGDNQVISSRYIWEIMKPGSFVTRSQNPQFFVDDAKKEKP